MSPQYPGWVRGGTVHAELFCSVSVPGIAIVQQVAPWLRPLYPWRVLPPNRMLVRLAARWNDRTAQEQRSPAGPVRPVGSMTWPFAKQCVGSTQSTWWTTQGVAKHCSLWAGNWPVPASHDMDGEVLSHCSPSCHHLRPVGCHCVRPPEHGSAPALVGSVEQLLLSKPHLHLRAAHNGNAL